MLYRQSVGVAAATALLGFTLTGALAFDDTKYPNLEGMWLRSGAGHYDPSKPTPETQAPPLTPEYQAIWDASLADQANGGQGNEVTYRCLPHGMPRVMIATQPLEIVVTPKITYVLLQNQGTLRRIYTDGRQFGDYVEPQFMGSSIGQWVDEDGDGKYDTLLIETRGVKNPHSYDGSGIPFHKDGGLVLKERMYLDKADPKFLRDEITAIDNALTRPWTVVRSLQRETKNLMWFESVCNEDNHHVVLGKENYVISGDGFLMPAKKDQKPPDLKYFNQAGK